MKKLKTIIPEELMESAGKPMENRAVGQYLVGVEASIVREAMNMFLFRPL
ncbi:hypothetical protein [Gluconobacter sp. GP1]|nr:hypothetical protein [Gluconobacter sp. GP1]